MNSIKVEYKLDIIFKNDEVSKASEPHRLLLNLLDKINFNRSEKICCFIKS